MSGGKLPEGVLQAQSMKCATSIPNLNLMMI